MVRKFVPENYIFEAQRHRDAKIYFEHGKPERHEKIILGSKLLYKL